MFKMPVTSFAILHAKKHGKLTDIRMPGRDKIPAWYIKLFIVCICFQSFRCIVFIIKTYRQYLYAVTDLLIYFTVEFPCSLHKHGTGSRTPAVEHHQNQRLPMEIRKLNGFAVLVCPFCTHVVE